ncbi:MerR family transcriptional regulator [Xanthobacter pseudotagetidis]|uniref:MerR family transcriptional regulator n=1 Tax=Xanthobacter pseudotagetidis TaxID=3119911 RepID=UPI00372C6EB2
MLDNKDPGSLQISDISRHAGVSASTIRVWEQQDLLRPTYTESGRRTYREADLQIALAIKRMRTVEGMKIAEIKAALAAQAVASPDPVREADEEASTSEVGANLRMLRLARRLTIRVVAEEVGMDPSVLASIERTSLGMDMPLLKKLARFYGVTLNKLMGVAASEPMPDREFVTRDHGEPLPRLGLGVRMERLNMVRATMACKRWFVEPGVHSNGAYRHEGEEFLVVIAGEFEITIDHSRVHHLTPGDTAYFRSDMFHSWRNPGRETAELIWIGVGDDF